MKNTKKILIVTLLLSSLHSNSDNLPGRMRNLNIFKLNEYVLLKLAAQENDSQNILRDLACNCDNPQFKMIVQFELNPFGWTQDIENLLQNPFMKNELSRLGILKEDGSLDIEKAANNPYVENIVRGSLANLEGQIPLEIEKKIMDARNRLKELLHSKDQNGKTALDIVGEKPDTIACMLTKIALQEMEGLLEIIEGEEKKQELECALHNNER